MGSFYDLPATCFLSFCMGHRGQLLFFTAVSGTSGAYLDMITITIIRLLDLRLRPFFFSGLRPARGFRETGQG